MRHSTLTAARFVIAALIVFAATRATHAQSASPVQSVQFRGLHRITESFAIEVAQVSPGSVAEPALLDAAVARLLRTGRFMTASYAIEPEGGGVRVIFDVKERPFVTKITVEGNNHFRTGLLLDEVDQKVDQPVDWFAVRDGRDAMIAKYKEEGYSNVQVSFDQPRLEQTGELVYAVDEGDRVRVRRVDLEGVVNLSEQDLRWELQTKTWIWIFRSGAFDKERAESDVARLQNYARDQGYLDAKVTYRTEPTPSGRDLHVIFTIEEGVLYTIEQIDIAGNSAISTEELSVKVRSEVGQPARRQRLEADAKAIQDHYGEQGYIDATAKLQRNFSDAPGLVRIKFEVEEGEQFRIGRVAVRGNTRTKDKVARRALNLFPPDDLFNLTEAREAEKRLVETRVFSSAKILPVGEEKGVRDAVIDVREADKAGDFIFGAGVTSNSGLVGSVVLDMQNFDIFDPPRSWTEFFKLRSFYGGGQRMRIELQPGTQVSRFRIDFTEPYLWDRPLRFDAGLYYFERKRDGYSESRIGSSVSLGKRFERGRLQGWFGELALRSELVSIDDIDLFTARDIKESEGDNWLYGLKGSLVRDRTDNRFVPSRGDRLRLSYEQLGGEEFFGKFNTGYSWYTTLRTDVLDRKHVLHLHAEGGAIVGDAPVYERYFAGGVGSIRGFEFRGIGPRQGLDDNNVGGDYLLLASAEYSYPLYGQNLRGHIFLDTGTAGGGAYRAAVGTGIRFTLDLFGPFPIELNVAMPIMSDSEDEEQVFSFVVGSVF